MMKLLRLLFGTGTPEAQNLSQGEVHRTHNEYTSELLQIQHKARIIEKEAKEIKRLIDTATKIAIATGAKRRGL